jgi:hypothetical protein
LLDLLQKIAINVAAFTARASFDVESAFRPRNRCRVLRVRDPGLHAITILWAIFEVRAATMSTNLGARTEIDLGKVILLQKRPGRTGRVNDLFQRRIRDEDFLSALRMRGDLIWVERDE